MRRRLDRLHGLRGVHAMTLVSIALPPQVWVELVAVLRALEPRIEGEEKRAAVRALAIEMFETIGDLQFEEARR